MERMAKRMAGVKRFFNISKRVSSSRRGKACYSTILSGCEAESNPGPGGEAESGADLAGSPGNGGQIAGNGGLAETLEEHPDDQRRGEQGEELKENLPSRGIRDSDGKRGHGGDGPVNRRPKRGPLPELRSWPRSLGSGPRSLGSGD